MDGCICIYTHIHMASYIYYTVYNRYINISIYIYIFIYTHTQIKDIKTESILIKTKDVFTTAKI